MNEARQVQHRLESLRRAGIDRIPKPAAIHPPTAADPPMAQVEPGTLAMHLEPPPLERDIVTMEPSLFPGSDEDLGELVPRAERPRVLKVLQSEVAVCPRCAILAATRTQTVFGEGSSAARLMFIGEAPGADEDRTGRPFVGRAGQLLTDMITKGMGLRREDVYIANILKCRPPENRAPMADEVANCRGYLERQIEVIRPEFLCLLGRTAAGTLLETDLAMGKLRGRWFRFRGIQTMVTFHPAYLLRNPAAKRETWDDLKTLMGAMGLTVPDRS